MNINVHIERLILDGITMEKSQRPRMQRAVENELARLLAENGPSHDWGSGGYVPQIRASGILPMNEPHPTRLGQQIAETVHGVIENTR